MRRSLHISIIAVGEVYDGVLGGRDPDAAEAALIDVLQRMTIVGLDLKVIRLFASINLDLKRTGMPLPHNDLYIAATALRHDLTLVTRNRKHFDRIDGLRIHDAS